MKHFGSTSGLTALVEDQATPANGMVAYVTSSYNSGYQNGDIKGAFLADTDDTDLVGGTDADRSVNNNPLTVNGTVTRTPVATGAELVAYSGFSASNYLEQPYNPDLDFGTGDFCVMGWAKFTGIATEYIFIRRDVLSAGEGPQIYVSNGIITFGGTTGGTISTPSTYNTGGWFFVSCVRQSGVLKTYVNGDLVVSGANVADLSNTTAVSRLGVTAADTAPLANGSLALWRISATAPSAEQIAKIYNDEKLLFQDNAACTLYGASDAVTALAHDPDTDLLHVGTSAGRSVFYGLRRLNNTTTPVTTAISAANGIIGEQ